MKFLELNLKEIGVLKINWELEFWKLNIRIGALEIKLKIRVLRIIWKLKSWKLNFKKNGILKNHLRMDFFFKINK